MSGWAIGKSPKTIRAAPSKERPALDGDLVPSGDEGKRSLFVQCGGLIWRQEARLLAGLNALYRQRQPCLNRRIEI